MTAIQATDKSRDPLKRYVLALVTAGLALFVRGVLPVHEGTFIYPLPLAAVILSAWYGGRGPGWFASLVCGVGVWYLFVPPENSFRVSDEHVLSLSLFIGICVLLTEFGAGRRRVESRLRVSEERFRTLLQFSFDVYWETDAQHRFTRQEFTEQFPGAPAPGSEIGKTRWEVPYLEPDEEAWRKHRETMDAHLPFRDFELARPTPTGGKRYVSVSGMPAFDEGGRFTGYRGVGRQITARKLVEAELRARQEMLDLAQSAARAVAFDWLVGAGENENRWSSELEALHGLEPGTFDRSYQGWQKLVLADDWPAVKQAIERAHIAGDVDAEYRVLHKDGSVHWLRARGRVFFDKEGRPERIVGFMLDVTGWRNAEEELRASEKRFRTFVDQAKDAFFLTDTQLRVVDVNRQACESLGLSREELIGMHPTDFDAGLDEQSIRQLAQRADAGETITFETRHRRKDGTIFPVEIRSGTFHRGEQLFYLSLARDITDRKQAEERQARLAAIVESSDDAIISKSLDGIITTWNSGAERIFGYAAREIVGQPVTTLLPPDRVGEVRAILERIRQGERVDHFETLRRRKDGTLLNISLTVSPIIDGSGNVVGASKVARDISERKLAEAALREKEDALEMARTELARVSRLTTLGELTTSIAHEVSQPIGAMVASAGACTRWLAANPPAMVEARSALDNIIADGKRARDVIARIRGLTKRKAPRKESLDINQKIAGVLALTGNELRNHAIVLRTELQSALPQVVGDRVQIEQVLLNLIVNAVEAMSGIDGRARELTIATQRDENAVLVEVRDTGAGFDAQSAERVFEAFFSTKPEGIGIGLSISRSIVEAHGGRLWAAPNEPHGAVFRFSLPVTNEAS